MSASKKKRILSYIVLSVFSYTCGQMYNDRNLYDVSPVTKKIECIHSRKQIEGVAKFVETPRESFNTIDRMIKFTGNHDGVNFTGDRWCSLRETYSLGTGDCDDGAIAFCALLSDNPQYKTWFVWLVPPKKSTIPGHAIAIFEEDNKYGYASFNHIGFPKNFNVFEPAKYSSINELIKNFGCKDYSEYALIKFGEQTLKFGRALQQNPNDLEWILVK